MILKGKQLAQALMEVVKECKAALSFVRKHFYSYNFYGKVVFYWRFNVVNIE